MYIYIIMLLYMYMKYVGTALLGDRSVGLWWVIPLLLQCTCVYVSVCYPCVRVHCMCGCAKDAIHVCRDLVWLLSYAC